MTDSSRPGPGDDNPASCAACGSVALAPHLAVAGDPGPAGLAPSTDRYGTALGDIARCRQCGHMQLDPLPAEAVLAAGYAEAEASDYLQEQTGQRATARAALAAIARHVAPGHLLDLGCWLGFLLAEARAQGWQGVGVEPSRFASAYARETLGLNVLTADLLEAELDPASFDAIVLGDVIEHLVDPGHALDRLARLGRPGAILYLTLPDAGSRVARLLGARWWSVIPTHVQYFTRNSLAILLHRHGWEVLELRTAPKAFTVDYYLGRLSGYSPALARALRSVAARAGVADRLVAPDFGDRMAVLARAPDAGSSSMPPPCRAEDQAGRRLRWPSPRSTKRTESPSSSRNSTRRSARTPTRCV